MVREFLFNFIQINTERVVLLIGTVFGWLWETAFGNHELSTEWLLIIMASCKLGEYTDAGNC